MSEHDTDSNSTHKVLEMGFTSHLNCVLHRLKCQHWLKKSFDASRCQSSALINADYGHDVSKHSSDIYSSVKEFLCKKKIVSIVPLRLSINVSMN